MPQNGCQNVEGVKGRAGKTKEEEGEVRERKGREEGGRQQRRNRGVRASEPKPVKQK